MVVVVILVSKNCLWMFQRMTYVSGLTASRTSSLYAVSVLAATETTRRHIASRPRVFVAVAQAMQA